MTDEKVTNDMLLESMRIQAAVSAEGFDWRDVAGVLAKVDEEVAEIRAAVAAGDGAHARKELGDLLLVTVNLARFLGADPREELQRATRRFSNRYAYLKKSLASAGISMQDCTEAELEMRWQEVKPRADKALRKGA